MDTSGGESQTIGSADDELGGQVGEMG